jgi:hypothetical protein
MQDPSFAPTHVRTVIPWVAMRAAKPRSASKGVSENFGIPIGEQIDNFTWVSRNLSFPTMAKKVKAFPTYEPYPDSLQILPKYLSS